MFTHLLFCISILHVLLMSCVGFDKSYNMLSVQVGNSAAFFYITFVGLIFFNNMIHFFCYFFKKLYHEFYASNVDLSKSKSKYNSFNWIKLGGGNNEISWSAKYTNGTCDSRGMEIHLSDLCGVKFLKEKRNWNADSDMLIELTTANDGDTIKKIQQWCNPNTFLFHITLNSWGLHGWDNYLNPLKTRNINLTSIRTGDGLLIRTYDFWASEFIWIPSREIAMKIFDEVEHIHNVAKENYKVLNWETNPLNVGWKGMGVDSGWMERDLDPNEVNNREWYEPLDIEPSEMKQIMWEDGEWVREELMKMPIEDGVSISMKASFFQ